MKDKDFSKLMEHSGIISQKRVRVGDIIEGKVVGEGANDFFVDYGGKSEAILPKDKADKLKIGDKVEVRVLRIEPDGTVYLASRISKDSVDTSSLLMAYESNMPVQGRVIEARKGGFSIELGPKIRAFCPVSHIDLYYTEDPSIHVNKTYWFKIIEFSETGDIVVSRKEYLKEEQNKKRDELLKSLEPGQIIEGKVSKIMDFGAFVDIGGIEGLVHVSELSWDEVRPVDILEEGQSLKVKVLKIERQGDNIKISLSLKALEGNPWDKFQELQQDAILEGEVVRLKPFGAFVRLAPGVEGLLHISELAWHRVSRPEDLLSIGDRVRVKIISIDRENKRISLSLREVEGAPEGEIASGAEVEGIVHEVKSFGLLITLPGGKIGLLPKRELGAVNPISFKEGQRLKVLIKEIDEENGRISLTTADKKDLLENDDYHKYLPQKQKHLATLGDLLKDLTNK